MRQTNDPVDNATGVVARAFGNTINPVVAGIMSVAGVYLNDPVLQAAAIPVAAVAGSLAEESVYMARRAWAAEGVELFVDEVENQLSAPVDEVVASEADRKARRLFGEAVSGATSSTDEWTIRTLASAFVRGRLDPARVDPMRILVARLAGLEIVDARVLAALERTSPSGSGVDQGTIGHADPGLRDVVPMVLEKLQGLGLIEKARIGVSAQPTWVLSWVGVACAGLLREIGGLETARVGYGP